MANQQQGDRRHQDNGQGQVKDPAHDARLKQNRDQQHSQSQPGGQQHQQGGQGRVTDPEHDGRLKQNR
ncbi:hypothetical protein [Sabulicella rubraurantiaca]|uniref:hypothetical protein n=1 Tax=Sabulicella rubraurantiaca TaxID=2811429 RepID=UPI001A97C0CD|nr:hypothetical protein [Sabulicella rubraurantiaca]